MTGVLVGVSPTTGSPAALQWGADEARLRGVPLRAVLAWRAPRAPAVSGTRPPIAVGSPGSGDYAADAETTLRGFVAAALGDESGVECTVVHGSAVNALLTEAHDADLLVVGEPRAGRLASMWSSLTAPQLILRAHCPVVVLPSAVVAEIESDEN